MKQKSYVVITPARDEEAHIEKTLQSMLAQTVLPLEWLIVNDGSTDKTGSIIESYSRVHPWIRVLNLENRGFRKPGGGVIEAFYHAYRALQSTSWDFLVKLDGDLCFDKEYFQKCLERFDGNARLGIGGGMIYHQEKGEAVLEKQPKFHVRGATKIYSRQCWQDIGGLLEAPGWDTLDEVKANMLGYQTESFDELRVIHNRHTGAANGMWGDAVKNGRADYISGYHPLFMLLKCLKRLARKPFLLGSLGLLYGFAGGYLKGIPQVGDKALISYLRQQQLRRLSFRKSIWR